MARCVVAVDVGETLHKSAAGPCLLICRHLTAVTSMSNKQQRESALEPHPPNLTSRCSIKPRQGGSISWQALHGPSLPWPGVFNHQRGATTLITCPPDKDPPQ